MCRMPHTRAAATSLEVCKAGDMSRPLGRDTQLTGKHSMRARVPFMEPRLATLRPGENPCRAQAAESARAVNALAYTVDKTLRLARAVRPERTEGRQLIAHELTHVVQQARGVVETAASSQHVASSKRAEPRFKPDTNGVRIEVTGSSAPGIACAPGSPVHPVHPVRVQPAAQASRHEQTQRNSADQVREILVGADEKLTAIVGFDRRDVPAV